jgi:Family of unknown function (DUF6526)
MADTTRVQNYANHSHRPYLTYAVFALGTAGFGMLLADWWVTRDQRALAMSLVAAAVLVLGSMSRIYTTTLQNRIIRLEVRLRLKDVLPAAQQAQIAALTTPQLVGLRFASDGELPALVDRAVRERLSREDIKRAVTHWVADWERT